MFSSRYFLSLMVAVGATSTLMAAPSALAKSYYVSTSGNDNFSGSAQSPFKTIGRAMKANLQPGDEVVVGPGTYRESVMMNRDGNATRYITLRSSSPGAAIINATGKTTGITVNANYVRIQGFEIFGANRSGIAGMGVHHIEILDNESHNNKTGGIFFGESDYLLIEGNETYENANHMVISGISVLHAQSHTGGSNTNEIRIIIRNNVSHHNTALYDAHTDGNGIIVDRFSGKLNGQPPYKFKTLVENNIVYNNGGKGIAVVYSENVIVRNNTSWHNSRDLKSKSTWRGELSVLNSRNVTFANNIAVADPSYHKDNKAFGNYSMNGYKNSNIRYLNNLTYNGKSGDASTGSNNGGSKPTAADGNKLGVNPLIIKAPSNFRLMSDSPAINAGTTSASGVGEDDFAGRDRTVGTVDMGAYEYGN